MMDLSKLRLTEKQISTVFKIILIFGLINLIMSKSIINQILSSIIMLCSLGFIILIEYINVQKPDKPKEGT